MSSTAPDAETTPEVTVIMACRNVEAFIDDAVRSVRRQTLRDLELVVAEDGSTDSTLARLEAHARVDQRIRILKLAGPSGAGAARNAALAAARGRWIAVLDGDDYMHPERLERLLCFARDHLADIVADNQVIFDEAARRNPRLLLKDAPARRVSVAEMVKCNVLAAKGDALGFLKPVIRRETLQASGVRYDEELRIGEDYDFLVRLQASGASLWINPRPLYFYRKYPGSTSHRLTLDDIGQMARADAAFRRDFPPADALVLKMMARREASLRHVSACIAAAEALKARRFAAFLKAVTTSWTAIRLFKRVIVEALAARVRRRAHLDKPPKAAAKDLVTIITRQRISGSNNGSSAYLLSLASSLQAVGFRLHLISPSPVSMGRWPALRLRAEMRVFERIQIRGCVRIGDLMVRASVAPFLAAVRVAVERVAARLGVRAPLLQTRKAPYSVSAPWEIADFLFLGQQVISSSLLIADYCYQTPALPYALQPSVGALVVMHDLFWRRRSDFAKAGLEESAHSQIAQSEEMKLLSQADVILAIQAEEAGLVRASLPDTPVIVTPMPAKVERQPSPGERPILLFVGSDTAANVHGADWFIQNCWPEIRRRRPDAEFWVVGGVRNSLTTKAPGVSLLGVVPDLAAVYRKCAVVVSPLILGSGLKVKLIEALGMGKAVVATTVTVAGVEEIVEEAVLVADEPEPFIEACVALLDDEVLRRRLGDVALDVARKHFSSPACHRGFVQAALALAQNRPGALHAGETRTDRLAVAAGSR